MNNENLGWIGVDLDGTLAVYKGWNGPEHIGEPIPIMIDRVKLWIQEGKNVKIFTARVSDDPYGHAEAAIKNFCEIHIGTILPITNIKDYNMIELWDDRAIQLESNTGIRSDGK